MALLNLAQIRNELASILSNAAGGATVRTAFPWIPARLAEVPAFYLVPPDIQPIDQPLGGDITWLLTYTAYYVVSVTGGETDPADSLVSIQDDVLEALMTNTSLRQYDAFVEGVTTLIENEFTQWCRLLSKPYIAIAFQIRIQVASGGA